MGKTKEEKPSTTDSKKKKKKKTKRKDSSDSSNSDQPPATANSSKNDDSIEDVEKAILDLRERGKEDPSIDFVSELRKIQDHISDVKGEERRPITAVVYTKKDMGEVGAEVEVLEQSKATDSDSDSDEDGEGEEGDEEGDTQLKELINRRLTTCMMLALSFESEDDYPRDFYEKLAESNKFKEVTKPFNKEEMGKLNRLIKERKKEAHRRLEECK